MRRFFLAAAMMGAVSTAYAADLPVLRGGLTDGLSSTSVNWGGFYVGGQFGYGSSNESFTGSTQNMLQSLLNNTIIEEEMGVAEWPVALGKQSQHTTAYGAFGGYNWQWTDAIIGAEVSYVHGAFGGQASSTQSRIALLSDNYFHAVTSTSSASISISDLGTFRARAGYAFGCFLPYAFVGVALGQADITRTATVTDSPIPNPAIPNLPTLLPATLTASEDQPSHLVYGYSAGLGFDVNLVGGLFLRGEYEYVRITSNVDTSINTVRAGLGYKF